MHRRHAGDRLQHTSGFKRDLRYWMHISIYRKVLGLLEQRGELTSRRKQAAIQTLWPKVRSFARAYPREAAEVVDWIYSLDPGFVPPVRPALALGLQAAGFATTERLLRFPVPAAMMPPDATDPGKPAGGCGRALRRFLFSRLDRGTEVYVRDLVTALSAHAIDSTIIAATDGSYNRYTWNGVEVVRYPIDATEIPKVRDRSVRKRRTMFQELVESASPDLFHLHSWTSGAGLRHLRRSRAWTFPASSRCTCHRRSACAARCS